MVVRPMTSMAVAGFATLMVMGMLICGMYGALIPTELTVTIKNGAGNGKSLSVFLHKGSEQMKRWTLSIDSNVTKSLVHQLDIGDYNVTVAVDGIGNCSITFNIAFKVLVKKHSESFAIGPDSVAHVPEKP